MLRDQVDILEDDDRRLQVPRELGHRPDHVQCAAREHEAGVARHLPDEIAGGVGLARARRPVQEQAALEVLPGAEQGVPMRGDAQRVPFHPGQHRLREHDVVAGGLRDRAELQREPTHGGHADLKHMAAKHVEPVAELRQPRVHGLRRVDGQAGDLHGHLLHRVRPARGP